jgi:dinuclear metal center YbgI/SA1388 family protein
MTVSQLYKILNAKIPRELSCEWDNDGLMCCPDGQREVKRVLIALDVTAEVTKQAIDGGYDLIVSHHPFIFKGLKSINEENFLCDKAIALIKNNISVFSFHTRLDAVDGGVNDVLAALVGIKNAVPFGDGIGRIGVLDEATDVSAFAKHVKDALGCDGVYVSDSGRACKSVAVLGGSGDSDLYAAMLAGADTYISGELKYHSMTDAPDMGVNLIQAGHFYTENPVCAVLKKMIEDADDSIVCDLFYSNRIKLI